MDFQEPAKSGSASGPAAEPTVLSCSHCEGLLYYDPNFANQMAIACSTELTDREKMDKLGFPSYFAQMDEGPDLFDTFFADHSIDATTGELFGRFIAEERDTIRLLRSCYDQLVEAETVENGSDPRMRALETKIDALCGVVAEVREAVLAQTGKSKPKAS